MDKEQKIDLADKLWQKQATVAAKHLLSFTKATMPAFSPTWFHESYYQVLDKFACGDIRKLMIFVPPQHGKSEGSTRRLPAYLLGHNPDRKIAIVSYSASKARKFNREIQRILDEPSYHRIFPAIQLSKGADGYARTMDEIEAVGYNGGIKTVGVGGALTGEPVDILIMDDLYKDAKTAWSSVMRDGIEHWYNAVAETRLHNNSRQLIVFTRWHQDDLAGYLLRKENDWEVFVYPAIKEGGPNNYDPRIEGAALWPERHSVAKLDAIRQRDPHIFGNLYQQNPTVKEGLLYKEYRTYKLLPADAIIKKAVIDTADTGADYLCSIVYAVGVEGYYILDILYTQEGMDTTEQLAATQVTKHGVHRVRVESNNGGKGFTRNVERICRAMGNTKTAFAWYHQQHSKDVRIYTRAAEVQNMIFYPEGWEALYPAFHTAVTGYMAQGRNKHDDAPDALTMIIEAEHTKPYNIQYT